MWQSCGTIDFMMTRVAQTHVEPSNTQPVELEEAFRAMSERLDMSSLPRLRPGSPDLGDMREAVRLLDRWLADLNAFAEFEKNLAVLVRYSALQASFPALLLLRLGRHTTALRFLILEWSRIVRALGGACVIADTPAELKTSFPEFSFHDPQSRELLTTFNTAVYEVLRDSENHEKGRAILRRFMAVLSLSFDQVGRAFGVSGETVRRWERGSHEIPPERLADLVQADAGLMRLLEIFRPERLGATVRRDAEIFSGETALDWILRGRITAVADRYEAALSYQG